MNFVYRALLLGFALALTMAGFSHTQPLSNTAQSCESLRGTTVIEACLNQSIKADQAALRRLKEDILSTLSTGERQQFKQSDALWSKYEGAACGAAHDLFEGGTGAPLAELFCEEAEDRSHIDRLKEIYGGRLKQALPR